jgi:nitrite reductase (NADH) small subunit
MNVMNGDMTTTFDASWLPLLDAGGAGGPLSRDDIPPGTAREAILGDAVLAVFHAEGELHAIDGICLHAGGPLAEGYVSGHVVTCPWHGWQYDLRTGANCLNARIRTKRFEIRVADDGRLFARPEAAE